LFYDGLERAAAVIYGRRSHEGGPNAARRSRLIVTRFLIPLWIGNGMTAQTLTNHMDQEQEV
jgi:hypothetical protein